MGKLTVRSHLQRLLTMPYMGELKQLVPGDNEVQEEILKSFAQHPVVKPMLLAGDAGGLEITAVDGVPCPHVTALEEFYPTTPEKLQAEVSAARERVFAEKQALEELIANAGKEKEDMPA